MKKYTFILDGILTPLDLFNADFIPALESEPDSDAYKNPKPVSSPLLYVGIHNHQLYVQESPRMLTISELSKRAINEISSPTTR